MLTLREAQHIHAVNEFTKAETVWVMQAPCGCAWLLDGTQIAYCPTCIQQINLPFSGALDLDGH